MQRPQQCAAQSVDARDHDRVDAEMGFAVVKVLDRFGDRLQTGAIHVRAGVAVVDVQHQVFIPVCRAVADDIGLLDIQTEAEIRLPVGGNAEISHVDKEVAVLVQLHGVVNDDFHV